MSKAFKFGPFHKVGDVIKCGPFHKVGDVIKCGPFHKVGPVWKCGPVSYNPGAIQIGRLRAYASRWPWQGYGWFPHKLPTGKKVLSAPLNGNGARFGGGWAYKLGVDLAGSTVTLNLLFGIVTLQITKKVVK